MSYDLKVIETECAAHNLVCKRVSDYEVEIALEPDCILFFANLAEEDDTMIGFKNTPWHSHDELTVMTSDDTSVELDPVEIVRFLTTGVLLIVSQWIDGKLNDRWLMHRGERLDLKYLEPHEELRVKQLAQQAAPSNGG